MTRVQAIFAYNGLARKYRPFIKYSAHVQLISPHFPLLIPRASLSAMSSRDYYRRQALPPIRDVLGDHLDRPPHDGPYSLDAMQRALPSTPAPSSRSRSTWPQTTGPTLAPIHAHSYAPPSHSHHGHGHTSSHSQSSGRPTPRTHSTTSNPTSPSAPYSFDVFRPTSSGLMHASSSDRSQGILRSTRADAGRRHVAPQPSHDDHDEHNDDRDKKYACPHCGKRFSRPSSLKTHEVVHSDEKPYECPHRGCGKTFTVPSNMRRHIRKTHDGAVSGDEDAEERHYGRSSSGQGSQTQYYFHRR